MKNNEYYILREKFRNIQLNSLDSDATESVENFNNCMVEFFNLDNIEINEDTLEILNSAKKNTQEALKNSDNDLHFALIRKAIKKVDQILFKKLKELGFQ